MVAAIALFCEDIREEKAGTVSVIGIYPDNINVPKTPVALPKCGIYTRLSFAVPTELPRGIALRLVHADGTEMPLGIFDPETIRRARDESEAKGGGRAGLISTAVISPFHIKKDGRINVIVKIDDEESVCGTLNVQIGGA